MKWSLRIARPFGIDLKVHATFFIILFIGALQWRDHAWPGMLFGVGLMLLLFLCVVLHEFGHALMARRFGIPVREVVLLPIGGVAVLNRNPDRPTHELLIAAAGPAVNVVIVALLLGVIAIYSASTGIDPESLASATKGPPSVAAALAWLLGMNVGLVLFNLIPAFPLDGGRILRGVVGLFTDWGRATRVATLTGQIIAVLMVLAGALIGSVSMILIAVLVFLGACATYADEQARAVLSTHRVGDAYNRHALTLSEHDRLSKAVDYILTSYQPDFAVVRGHHLLGVVTRQDVLGLMSQRCVDLPVLDVMSRDVLPVRADDRLDDVRTRLAEASLRLAAVYDKTRFLGLVSLEDIAEAHAVLKFVGDDVPWPAPREPEPRVSGVTLFRPGAPQH